MGKKEVGNNITRMLGFEARLIIPLFILWSLIQFYFYQLAGGVIVDHEAKAYLRMRDLWLRGDFRNYIHMHLYSGYVLFLFLTKWLGLPQNLVYVFQLVITFCGVLAFMKSAQVLTKHRLAPYFAGLMMITCYMYQIWTVMFFTESIFLAFICMMIYALLRYNDGNKYVYLFWGLFIYFLFLRPNGYLFAVPAAVFFATFHKRDRLWKFTMLLIPFFIFSYAGAWLAKNGEYFYFFRPNVEGDIICGIASGLTSYVKVPWKPGMSLSEFYLANPDFTMRLIPQRFFRTLWMTRPFYTVYNNMIVAVSLILYYGLAIWGIIIMYRKKNRHAYWMVAGLIVFLVPAAIMCAEWNNRLIAPFFPFLFLLTLPAIEYLLARFLPKYARMKGVFSFIPDLENKL